jgi:hypothetical protein
MGIAQGGRLSNGGKTANNSSTNARITYGYQWARCPSSCSAIAGAIGSSYTLTSADVGAKISVVVTATNSAGSAPAVAGEVGPVDPRFELGAGQSGTLEGAQAVWEGGEAQGDRQGRRLQVHFTAPSAGKLVIDWFAKVKGKQVLVASASVVFHQAGKVTVKLKLTGKGRKLLRAGKSVKITTKATFTPSGGTPTTSTRTTTLKP